MIAIGDLVEYTLNGVTYREVVDNLASDMETDEVVLVGFLDDEGYTFFIDIEDVRKVEG